MQNTISITEGRKRLFQIAKEIQKPDTTYVLTDNGSPAAVLVSPDEFESMLETIEVTREFPDLKKDIALGRKEFELGKTVALDDLLDK